MPNTPKLSEDVENRVRELYLKDYVADETESREMILIGMKDPWYEWWINIISQELSTLKAQVRKEIEEQITKMENSNWLHGMGLSGSQAEYIEANIKASYRSIPSLKGEE